eukprot:15308490-Ditylum_brightwellii.AAC.1
MGRALSLAASCYALAGSAITAEGLYQSSLESLSKCSSSDGGSEGPPQANIHLRNTYMWYADLCENWDKRESDVVRLRKLANEVGKGIHEEEEEGTEEEWLKKDGLNGGLWFFSLGDFR